MQVVNSDLLNGWDVTLLNTAPMAVLVVDSAGCVRYTNTRLDEIFGYGQGQLHNRSLEVLIPARLHAIHTQHFRQYMDDPRIRQMGSLWRWLANTKMARKFRIEVGLSYFHRHDELFALVTIVDISVHKRAQQELRQSEERYRRLVDLSPYAIFINRQNRIIYVNPSCARLFGATRADDLIGRSLFSLFHPDVHSLVQERVQCTLETLAPLPAVEEKIVRLDGTIIDVEAMAVAYQDKEGMAIQVILTDITERKYSAQILETSSVEATDA